MSYVVISGVTLNLIMLFSWITLYWKGKTSIIILNLTSLMTISGIKTLLFASFQIQACRLIIGLVARWVKLYWISHHLVLRVRGSRSLLPKNFNQFWGVRCFHLSLASTCLGAAMLENSLEIVWWVPRSEPGTDGREAGMLSLLFRPQHLSLKVPNIKFNFDLSVDCGEQLHQNRIWCKLLICML